MGKLEDFSAIALTDCASHYIAWLKACFGEVVLFCDGQAGRGGTVGWSPRAQFNTALWGFHQAGVVAECVFFALPGAGSDVEAGDLVLDVAFGSEAPFRGYTEVRLVALARSVSEEAREMRTFTREQASGAAMLELIERLRQGSRNT